MSRIGFTKDDYDSILVVCDYLFFDQFKDVATYPRFEECFGPFNVNNSFDLEKVYQEICGEGKTYINFRRILRAYVKYKRDKNVSADLKKFFDLIVVSSRKKEGEFVGVKEKRAKKFTTANCKRKNCITQLSVLTTEDNDIQGIQLVYDEFFKNNLYKNKGGETLYVKLEINLGEIQQNAKFPFLGKRNCRDAITHIFGMYDDKINFLGFKCRSGKTNFIGKPKGTPFLFGEFQKQFHYIKLEIGENGLVGIEPYFIKTQRFNPFLSTHFEKINDNFISQGDAPIYEEAMMKGNTDMRKSIFKPLIRDDTFFNKKYEDKIKGLSLLDVYPTAKTFLTDRFENVRSSAPLNHTTLMKEIEEFRKRRKEKREERRRKKMAQSVMLEKQGRDSIFENRHKKRWFPLRKSSRIRDWDGSNESATPGMFLSSIENYDRLFQQLGSMIDNDKVNNKELDTSSDSEFFGSLLRKSTFDISYRTSTVEEPLPRKVRSNQKYSKQSIGEKVADLKARMRNMFKGEDEEKYKKAQKNWQLIYDKFSRKSGIFILRTIGAVIKALRTLREDDKKLKMSLNDKLKLYEILYANRPIIEFLAKAHDEAQKRQIEEQQEYDEEEDDVIVPEELDEDEDSTDDNLKVDDLPDINNKIQYIEDLMRKDPKNAGNLRDYYEQLKKQKNKLIEQLNKADGSYGKDLGFDPRATIQKEEEERKKLIEEENERIRKQKEEEEKKRKEKTKIVSITNLEIPKNTKIYRNQKICRSGATFTDSLFPPEKKSLCPVDARGRFVLPPDVYKEDVEGWENIQFARVEEIFRTQNYQVFEDGIDHEDICQGGLGDCYFLSSLAALCKFPKMIERLFYFQEKSAEHCYGVYLRINGKWKLVLVDDFIPCYGAYVKDFAFSSTNGNELWVILLEKVWAKVNGSYANVIGGEPQEVFNIITDAYSERIDVIKKKSKEIWDKLLEGQKNGFIMTAGTSGDTYNLDLEDYGLVPGHAYTVLGVNEVTSGGKKIQLVHLYNPWGNGEWSGDWCDGSDKWTSSIKKQVGFEEKTKDDDGQFFMSYEDFIKFYVSMGICKLHSNYVSSMIKIEKVKSKVGPVITKVEVTTNKTQVYLQLHQKNPRIELKKGGYQKPVLIYMMLVNKDFSYISSSSGTDTILCVETVLNKGTYYLITDMNYRYTQPKDVHGYNISCYSSSPVGLFEDKQDPRELLKKGLYTYAQFNLSPSSDIGGKLYQSKRYSKEFSFCFTIFENILKNSITVTDKMKTRGGKTAVFYLEDNETSESLVKTVKPKEYEVFIHMPFTTSSLFEYSLSTQAKVEQNDMEEMVFREEPSELDDEGMLRDYMKEVRGGYLVGIENRNEFKVNLKLNLCGLYEVGNPNKTSISFSLPPKGRKVFQLKVKDRYRGDITYSFDYSD